MEKKMNNKGFSLVELIIVVAIMAVLIGVLAPAYLQYVEKSKKTTDCTAVGDIMNAIETIAADPAITWPAAGMSATLTSTGTTYSDTANGDLNKIVPSADVALSGQWSGDSIAINASKGTNGIVTFTLTMSNSQELSDISPALMKRFTTGGTTGGSTGGTTTP